jgi:hypothetical protein
MKVVFGFLEAYGPLDVTVASRPASFGASDLRLANRGGARISAAEIAAVLERRRTIARALKAIDPCGCRKLDFVLARRGRLTLGADR